MQLFLLKLNNFFLAYVSTDDSIKKQMRNITDTNYQKIKQNKSFKAGIYHLPFKLSFQVCINFVILKFVHLILYSIFTEYFGSRDILEIESCSKDKNTHSNVMLKSKQKPNKNIHDVEHGCPMSGPRAESGLRSLSIRPARATVLPNIIVF